MFQNIIAKYIKLTETVFFLLDMYFSTTYYYIWLLLVITMFDIRCQKVVDLYTSAPYDQSNF